MGKNLGNRRKERTGKKIKILEDWEKAKIRAILSSSSGRAGWLPGHRGENRKSDTVISKI